MHINCITIGMPHTVPGNLLSSPSSLHWFKLMFSIPEVLKALKYGGIFNKISVADNPGSSIPTQEDKQTNFAVTFILLLLGGNH